MREKGEENIWEEGLIYRITVGLLTSGHRDGSPVGANMCPLERSVLTWQFLTHHVTAATRLGRL